MTGAAKQSSSCKHFSRVPYLADVLISGIGLILLSILNGHVFRVLFDDETTTLMVIEKFRTLELFEAFYGFDVHPPLAYVYYSFLSDLGTSIEGMRFISLFLAAVSCAAWHYMFLQNQTEIGLVERLFALFVFATTPLVINIGDSLRWYPLFLFVFTLASLTYLSGRAPAIRMLVVVLLLGTLSMVNFLGFVVAGGFVFYRYVFERVHPWSDLPFALGLALVQFPALYYLYGIVDGDPTILTRRGIFTFTFKIQGWYMFLTGVFGGHTLGIGRAWATVPLILVFGLLFVANIRKVLATRCGAEGFAYAVTVAALAFVVLGHTTAKSYVFCAPLLALLMSLWFARTSRDWVKYALFVTVGLAHIASLANAQDSDRPYRRTDYAPYEDMVEFLTINGSGASVVLATDINIAYYLRDRLPCVYYFEQLWSPPGGCPADVPAAALANQTSDLSGHRLLIVEGRWNLIGVFENRTGLDWEAYKEAVIGEKRLIVTAPYKVDHDAALKSRLSGRALSEFIFRIEVYE